VLVAALIGWAPPAEGGSTTNFETPEIAWWGMRLNIEGTIILPFTEDVTLDVPDELVGADCEVFAVNNDDVFVGNTVYVSTGAFAQSATGIGDTAGLVTPLGSATAGPTVTVGIGFAPTNWFAPDGNGGMMVVGGFANLSVRFECDVTSRPPPSVAVDAVLIAPMFVG
jgi:hypothetical protein